MGIYCTGAVGEELTARAQTFREDLEKVLEKYKNLEYFGGIGSQVGRFSEIKRSYNDANRAFAERFSRSLRQFVSYSEVHQMGFRMTLRCTDSEPWRRTGKCWSVS